MERYGAKWSINEILSLQREHELLKMSVQDISIKHKRSVQGILSKLKAEMFIDEFEDAIGYGDYINKNLINYVDNHNDKHNDKHNDNDNHNNNNMRIDFLEKSIEKLDDSLNKIFSYLSNQKNIDNQCISFAS